MEVDSWVRRKFEGAVKEVEIVMREDLDLVRPALFSACWPALLAGWLVLS